MLEKRRAITAFLSGCFGGITINALNLLFGFLYLSRLIGADFAADFNLIDLLSDIFWGGMWGLLFLIPVLERTLMLKGMIIGALSFCVQILITISYIHHHAVSIHDPIGLIVYLFALNVFWGIVTAFCWNSWKDLANERNK